MCLGGEKMKIKEAVEFLDHMANSFKCISSLNCKSINNKKNEIVDLLEQGEKHWQMWESLEDINKLCKEIPLPIPEEYLSIQGGEIKYVAKYIKQKYFPKGK